MMILLLALVLDSAAVSQIAVAPHESLTVRAMQVSRSLADGKHTPIVLLPGLLGGTFAYRKVTPDIEAEGHSTYVIEPLGVGSSSHPDDGDYSLDAQADRVAAVLDTFDVTNAIIGRVELWRVGRTTRRLSSSGAGGSGAATRWRPGGPLLHRRGITIALRLAPLLKFFGGRGMARHRIADALKEYSADPSWVTGDVIEAYSRPIVNNIGGAARVLSAMRRAPVNTPLGGVALADSPAGSPAHRSRQPSRRYREW